MHIAILKHKMKKKGGLEKYTFRLGEAFQKKSHRVTLLTSDDVENCPLDAISFGKLSSIGYRDLKKFDAACISWIKDSQPDIVFGMDRNSCQTHYRAGNGVHAEYLQRRQESPIKRLSFPFNPLHRLIINLEKRTYEDPHIQCIFANSNMVKQEIIKHYNTPEKKIQVVHNGVEWNELQSKFDIWEEVRKSYRHEFLFIGHEYKRKGLEPLLKALSLIDCDFHLSVIGKERKHNLYQQLVHNLNLSKKVTFYGNQENVTPFYLQADTLVVPSLYDPFANVTVEALALGLFVVTSPHNGGKEVLNRESGIIVNNCNNSENFADKLRFAMEHPKTATTASQIRHSVQHLDFQYKLDEIVEKTLKYA